MTGIRLYHGTTPENAAALLENGWSPSTGQRGGNCGQSRYLYLTTMFEDALWFSEAKGCDMVLELSGVPIEALIVDPEDGSFDSVVEEISNTFGLPGKVALTRPLAADHFRLAKVPSASPKR